MPYFIPSRIWYLTISERPTFFLATKPFFSPQEKPDQDNRNLDRLFLLCARQGRRQKSKAVDRKVRILKSIERLQEFPANRSMPEARQVTVMRIRSLGQGSSTPGILQIKEEWNTH
jgi:hypothetical protein